MNALHALPTDPVDLLVIGSGAAGLSAAVTAAALGLRVAVVDKEAVIGGTSAWSGGWLWIPRNRLAVNAGITEDIDGPRSYLRHELGEAFDAARIEAFLRSGPRMVDFFSAHTALQFIDGNGVPDFHGHSPGAVIGGRSLCAAPFDGRALGEAGAHLRPPLDLISFWGMGIASGADVRHFLNAARTLPSLWHVVKRVSRHLRDLAVLGRGMQLVNGNALVARLMKSALDRGVTLSVNSPVVRLLQDGERVCGAVIRSADGRQHTVHATRGVVLACGGFPHDKGRIAQLFAHAPTGDGHFSAAPPSNTGDGLRLGEMVAGEVIAPGPAAGAWAPVSRVPRRDGSVGHFPHLLERAKPGLIAVTPTGQRFANEANSYFDVMSALLATGHRSAWLLCDHRFIRRYGLGHAKPAPVPLRASLRSGYLQRGHTLAELAQACGIDETSLQATVAQYNDGARRGVDAQFQRGDTPYNRVQGDASQQPNPCVAPLEHGPFYAVQIVPGSLGTFAGLRTDEHARVQRADGSAIAGLYAVGNDQASLMGGRYPSGGITLGPGMTFGFIAAHHAAGVPSDFAAGVPNDFAADMPHEQATSAAP